MPEQNLQRSGAVSPDSFRYPSEPPDSPLADPMCAAFQQVALGICSIPAGRLRSLALTQLESSFLYATAALLEAEGKR